MTGPAPAVLLFAAAALLVSGTAGADAIEYDVVLRLAEQAHGEISVQLEGADVPPDVQRLFDVGTGELAALREAIGTDDHDASERHFLSAMDTFKKLSHMISESRAGEIADDGAPAADLESTLERIGKYLANLKNIARTHGTDVDFSELNGLLGLARQQIHDGDRAAARESIREINGLIVEVDSELRITAQQAASDRAQQFARQYLDMLDEMVAQAEDLGYPDDVTDAFRAARQDLAESSDSRQIIDEIKRIMSLKEQFDASKSDRIALRADQIEERLDELSVLDGVRADEIEDARGLVSELRSSVRDGDHDEAQSLLRMLTYALKSLENSAG